MARIIIRRGEHSKSYQSLTIIEPLNALLCCWIKNRFRIRSVQSYWYQAYVFTSFDSSYKNSYNVRWLSQSFYPFKNSEWCLLNNFLMVYSEQQQQNSGMVQFYRSNWWKDCESRNQHQWCHVSRQFKSCVCECGFWLQTIIIMKFIIVIGFMEILRSKTIQRNAKQKPPLTDIFMNACWYATHHFTHR